MSLVRVLKDKSEKAQEYQRVIREFIPKTNSINTLSGKKAFSKEYEMKVPYNLTSLYDSTVVGTSFDYLARFKIAHFLEDEKIKEEAISSLFCERVLDMIFFRCDSNVYDGIKNKYDNGMKLVKNYIFNKNETLSIEIIEFSQFISMIEHYGRSGVFPNDIYRITDEITNELINLCNLFDEIFIDGCLVKPNSIVKFNPQFGEFSRAIRGADADIYIDGTLYDFKTSKRLGYSWQDIAQITSYYLFADISFNNQGKYDTDLDKNKIDKIAIYSARFGEIAYYDTKDFEELKQREVEKNIMRVLGIDK